MSSPRKKIFSLTNSSCPCNKFGVLFMGEYPRAGIPIWSREKNFITIKKSDFFSPISQQYEWWSLH